LTIRKGDAMNPLVQRLQEGKKQTAEKCMRVADKYLPYQKNGRPIFVFYRKNLTGNAHKTHIHAPRPITRKALYIFLHECAHIHLGHCNGNKKPRHREEYEAEQWAHMIMRLEGVAVPKSMTQRAKGHVGRKIDQALRRKAKKIDRESAEYAGKIKELRGLEPYLRLVNY
jgi:hypothetical protein